MTRSHAPRWDDYQAVLFSNFDPCESYLTHVRPVIRDSAGRELVEVESSIELVLLGYAACREIGGDRLPSPDGWNELLAHATMSLRQRLPEFDIRSAVLKPDARVEFVGPDTYSKGSLEFLLLGEEIESRAQAGESAKPWRCLQCLMWIDAAVGAALDRDALEAIEYALRARESLMAAQPRTTRADIQRELARASAMEKLARDPKQQMMREAKGLWLENRARFKSKAALARFVQDKLPDLESEANLVRRFGEWEKEASEAPKP
jgi:hypothetical protein